MKKIYKRSFLSSYRIKVFGLPFFIGCFFILFRSIDDFFAVEWTEGHWVALILCILLLGSMFYYGLLITSFYIKIRENDIEIKNGLIPVFKRLYSFDNLKQCLIEYFSGINVHYLILTNNTGDASMKYGLDLVDPKDLKEIISILESKGVTVITKDLKDV